MTLTANSSISFEDPDPGGDGAVGNPLRSTTPIVTAVLVAHDGAPWLARSLAAIAAQTRLPDQVVAVDTGSRDETPGLLRKGLGPDRVVTLDRTVGFGAAVQAGLASAAARSTSPAAERQQTAEPQRTAQPPEQDGPAWIWLLHDDCAPEPEALARMLDVVRRSPSIGVAGPKLVSWDDADVLLEVGLTMSRGGRRRTDIEPGERDQGQQDHRQDVLAVGTAGLLVRREVWDRLGGLDPAYPLFRDDIDFGWRAQLAGHRVVVVPDAKVADAQASSRGLRPVDAVRGAPRRVDRTHGLQVAMTGAPLVAVPFLFLWFAVGGLLRTAGLLIAKAPRRAYDELVSVGAAVLTPWRVVASKWRSRGIREVPRRDIAQLLAPRGSAFQGLAEAFSGSLAGRRLEVLGGPGAETGPAAEEAENAEVVRTRLTSRVLSNPGLLVVLAACVVTAGLSRRLVGRGTLLGGQLLGYSASAGQVWHSYVDPWHGSGLGTNAPPAPYRAVVAALAWLLQPLSSQPSTLAVDVLLIGAVPLSALTAYLAARAVLRNRWVRAWAALTWATLPTVTGALTAGRLGASALHVLLPLVVLGVARTLRRPGSSTAAYAGGLALALAGAFVPAVLLVAAAAVLVALVVGGWARRARALLLLVVPAVLLAPWLPALSDDPRLFLSGPGILTPSGAGKPLEIALLHPAGAAGGYLWLSVPLLVAGLAGLLRKGGSWLLASCGLLALTGLALALGVPRVVIATGTPATAGAGLTGSLGGWSGTGIDLLAIAALVAALHGIDGLPARLSRFRFGWRQLVLAPLALAAVLATLATAALLVAHPADGPVTRSTALTLPAVVVDQAEGPLATRTLVLSASSPGSTGGLGYRLVGAEVGDAALTLPLPDAEPMVAAVTQTLVDTSIDVRASTAAVALQHLGIGFVVVVVPVPAMVEQQLDTTPGLTRLGQNGGYALWRVEPIATAGATATAQPQPPARVRLVDTRGRLLQDVPVSGPHARVSTTVPSGPAGRKVVLAEPASDTWRASLDGTRLTGGSSAGLQTFRLPAGGGHLRVYSVDDRHRLLLLQGVALVVICLLALPIGRRRRHEQVLA
jgi:GT2 family glycosyltransferase